MSWIWFSIWKLQVLDRPEHWSGAFLQHRSCDWSHQHGQAFRPRDECSAQHHHPRHWKLWVTFFFHFFSFFTLKPNKSTGEYKEATIDANVLLVRFSSFCSSTAFIIETSKRWEWYFGFMTDGRFLSRRGARCSWVSLATIPNSIRMKSAVL